MPNARAASCSLCNPQEPRNDALLDFAAEFCAKVAVGTAGQPLHWKTEGGRCSLTQTAASYRSITRIDVIAWSVLPFFPLLGAFHRNRPLWQNNKALVGVHRRVDLSAHPVCGLTHTDENQWYAGASNNASRPGPVMKTHAQSASVILPGLYCNWFRPYFGDNPAYNITQRVNSKEPEVIKSGGDTWHEQEFRDWSFTLTVTCLQPDQCNENNPFEFYGMDLATQVVPPNAATINATLDDASSAVVYHGFAAPDEGLAWVKPTNEDEQNTISYTNTVGAKVAVIFQGTAITAYGYAGPGYGTYQVVLDGVERADYNASRDIEVHHQLLAYITSLDDTQAHTLEIINKDSALLAVDSWTVYGDDVATFGGADGRKNGTVNPTSAPAPSASGPFGTASEDSSPGPGAIAGIVIGVLAALVLFWFLYRWSQVRAANAKKKDEPRRDANNDLDKQKNEGVHVTTEANQRYFYPGLIAHSKL